jgi:hypothetical protein
VSVLAALASTLGLSRAATASVEEAADMAKAVFGGGGLARIADMIADHDWGGLVDLTIQDIARCIAIADPALAKLAPMAASLVVWARHCPAAIDTPAMQKAAGSDNVVTGG